MSEVLRGVAVSSGYAIGTVLKLDKAELIADTTPITADQVEAEKKRFSDAITEALSQYKAMIAEANDPEKTGIFEAHMGILEDPALLDMTNQHIEDLDNAENALSKALEEISAMFSALDDEYLKERVADYRDVCGRLMHILKNVPMVSLANLSSNVVVIAKDLAPSDTATMDIAHVLGFATDLGGRTSHTAIMARNMEIPAVVGTSNVTEKLTNGDLVIVDGCTGDVILRPDEETITEYKAKQAADIQEKKDLEALRALPAVTTDGHHVELAANVGSVAETEIAVDKGADAIGLFRTEFLYMDNTHFPTEEEQFAAYKNTAEAMKGKPVIIRTLDIGGDKSLSYYTFPEEENPFLGWRAIRLCLDRTDIFKTQLRAILRASAFGKIRIMYPMIISVTEVQRANALLDECKKELTAEGQAFDANIETGIMVETPAAAVTADVLAKYVDFFSIGTNDLTQYTLAVDRGNEKIQSLYNSYHPAVLRNIKMVIDASHKEGKWTGMCGEFAGETKATKMLLGMGLDEFSMSASSIARVKKIVRATTFNESQHVAAKALSLETPEDVEAYLDSIAE